MKTCPKMQQCSAPLCPLRDCSNSIFYVDEQICTRQEFRHLGWLIKQKQIAKLYTVRTAGRDEAYFTLLMLKSLRDVPKDIVGINPDLPEKKALRAEKAWIKARGKPSKIVPEATGKPKKASVPWNE